MISQSHLIFFIGTEAELIKVFPIMQELQNRSINYIVIASGQGDIANSRILKQAVVIKALFSLSNPNKIKKNVIGLFTWFIKIILSAKRKIKNSFPEIDFKNAIIMVHGDTLSTLMGAYVGKKLRARVAHIEAGLRSFDNFNPFPEEICRKIASSKADLHFAAGQAYCDNLKKKKNVINTNHNTLYDSLQFSKTIMAESNLIDDFKCKPFFIYVLHRQENVSNSTFIKQVTRRVIELSKQLHCVFVLHKITEIALIKIHLLKEIEASSDITILPRMNYFDFTKLLELSEFVITDGGSNQEELYYMGKPCLIMRKCTERFEGLGANAKLFGGDIGMISSFIDSYHDMKMLPLEIKGQTPSQIIVDELTGKYMLME